MALPHRAPPARRSWPFLAPGLGALVVGALATGCGGDSFTVAVGDGALLDGGLGTDAGGTDARSPRDGGRSDVTVHDGGAHHDAKPAEGGQASSADDAGGRDASLRDAHERDVALRDAKGRDAERLDSARDVRLAADASSCPGGGPRCGSGDTCAMPGPCVSAQCQEGCCMPTDLTEGTVCSSAGQPKQVCDGHGACVSCVHPSDCPATGTDCLQATCQGNVCGQEAAQEGTDCSDHGGSVCNDVGNCVECTPHNQGACTGTTPYCGSTGQCVQCLTKANCTNLDSCVNGTCMFL